MSQTGGGVGSGSGSGSSPWEKHGQSQAPGGEKNVSHIGGGQEGSSQKLLTRNDAVTYLSQVKEAFQDGGEKYDMFNEVMRDFRAQKIDTAGVIARVKELFKGHNNLLYGFNTFLPKEYEITLDDHDKPLEKSVELKEAISFVLKIKERFQNNKHVYISFLDILKMYRTGQKDINEVYNEVVALFKDHQELLDEFKRYLPQKFPYGQNSTQAQPNNEQNFVSLQDEKDSIIARLVDLHLRVDSPDVAGLDDDKTMMEM
ncbi:hypothetical protein SLE2022_192730 [Rubroshorea leprosula]